MGSRGLFTLLLAATALVRLGELRLARRHTRTLRARGAREVGQSHYPWMVALHTGWLAGSLAEVWWLGPPFRPVLAATMLGLVALAWALRGWAIRSLGERWTTRVLVVPGAPLVATGPYRFLRHPNYLAVAVEIVALPLVHGAWRTAVLASLANAAVLAVRIRVEDRALRAPGVEPCSAPAGQDPGSPVAGADAGD